MAQGDLQGEWLGDAIQFVAIPYAAAPIGPLRFRPPAPPSAWSGWRDATQLGPPCAQLDASGGLLGSEDCLTVSVWRPSASTSPLPILFFIHGGGNSTGSVVDDWGSLNVVSGQHLATHGPAVVVEIQYRLGPFGFLAHPAFAAESSLGATGNYGLMDQIAALKWVEDNAAAFGGDPSRIMVFGQSAGGRDACLLVASPRAKGHFSAAVVESGGCLTMLRAVGETAAVGLANNLGCSGDIASCLRATSTGDLAAAKIHIPGGATSFPDDGDVPPDHGWKYPVIDGDVLPDAPLALLGSPEHADIPVIMNNCRDEFANKSLLAGIGGIAISSADDFAMKVRSLYGATYGSAILAHYPVSDYASPEDAFIHLASDSGYICATRRVLRALAANQHSPVWRSVFSRKTVDGYAPHASELPYVFHTLDQPGYERSHDADDVAIADAMTGYWTRFAATGDPNGDGAIPWPKYEASMDPFLDFDTPLAVSSSFRAAQCDWHPVHRELDRCGEGAIAQVAQHYRRPTGGVDDDDVFLGTRSRGALHEHM